MHTNAIEAQAESSLPQNAAPYAQKNVSGITEKTFEESKILAHRLQKSTSRTEIPLRKIFVRRDNLTSATPLMMVYRGGKGGEIALKLYIALLWKAVSSPYEIKNVSSTGWAGLLGLYTSRSTPQEKIAARERISKALKKLEKLKLIEIYRHKGTTPTIKILAEDMSGNPYNPPSNDAYIRKNKKIKSRKTEDFYLKIPTALWTSGDFQALSGAALVMYLIIAAEFGYTKKVWFSTSSFPERYGISASTRAKGTKELEGRGILGVSREVIDRSGQEISMEVVRSRKVYSLWKP